MLYTGKEEREIKEAEEEKGEEGKESKEETPIERIWPSITTYRSNLC